MAIPPRPEAPVIAADRAHSPLPWRPTQQGFGVLSASDYLVLVLGPSESKDTCYANREFIVTAVNAHHELVAALQEIDVILDAVTLPTENGIELIGPGMSDVRTAAERIKVVLATLKGV